MTDKNITKTLSGKLDWFKITDLVVADNYQLTMTANNLAGSSPPYVRIATSKGTGAFKWTVQIYQILYLLDQPV